MVPSDEVNQAVGASPDAHDAEIEQLQSELSAPSEREQMAQRLASLKAERASKRLAQHMTVAERRRVGIRRAAGSLAVELDQDVGRFIAAVQVVVAYVETCNARFEKVEGLRAEDGALADRFGLLASDLAQPVAPGVRADVVAAYEQLLGIKLTERTDAFRPQVEQDAHGLRARRTYGEIAGAPGYAIILEAGLAEFPPLTDRQEAIVAERAGASALRASRAQEQSAMLADEAARLPRRPDGSPLS